MDSKTLAERIRLRADAIAVELASQEIDSNVAMAYGVPPVETPASERLDERHKIAAWLRQISAVSILGRRTVSVLTVDEVTSALADAITDGKYQGGDIDV